MYRPANPRRAENDRCLVSGRGSVWNHRLLHSLHVLHSCRSVDQRLLRRGQGGYFPRPRRDAAAQGAAGGHRQTQDQRGEGRLGCAPRSHGGSLSGWRECRFGDPGTHFGGQGQHSSLFRTGDGDRSGRARCPRRGQDERQSEGDQHATHLGNRQRRRSGEGNLSGDRTGKH